MDYWKKLIFRSTPLHPHLGFKRTEGNRLVTLVILGKTNEKRAGVKDPEYAQFRTSRARVINIKNFNDSDITYEDATSVFDPEFIYHVGDEVFPKLDYDTNLPNQVCGNGIHYFTTKDAARDYFGRYDKRDGEYKEWSDNGQLEDRGAYRNGKQHGEREIWYSNGHLSVQSTFRDGHKHGVSTLWSENGKMSSLYTYRDGIWEGKYISNYDNGQTYCRGNYKDNIRVGIWKMYDTDGRLRAVADYDVGIEVTR